MAEKNTRALAPAILAEDVNAFSSLKGIGSYDPANADFSLGNLQTAYDRMINLQITFAQKEADYKAARDEKVLAEWDFHEKMLGAKDQVVAQYGSSSNEVQALGLKKKSEYKKPSGRKPASK